MNTVNALVARGLDSKTARELSDEGHTINSLKASSFDELRQLGLEKDFIDGFLVEDRPPIPEPTVIKMLYESAWACCVCRENDKGVIIHHIIDWSTSRSHDEENLVVLCSNHHGEAHTTRKIQLQLTASRLRELKNAWLQEVRERNAAAALGRSPDVEFSIWDHFNHSRLTEIARNSGVKFAELPSYKDLIKRKAIKRDGLPAWGDPDSFYLYEGSILYDHKDGYSFYTKMIRALLQKTDWRYITDEMWDRTHINSLLSVGTILVIKAGFYFSRLNSNHQRPGQIRRGLRRKNHIHLMFTFDAWESTSSSSWALHLSGHSVVTCVCAVRSIGHTTDHIVIKVSSLALGTGFGPERLPYNPLYGPTE